MQTTLSSNLVAAIFSFSIDNWENIGEKSSLVSIFPPCRHSDHLQVHNRCNKNLKFSEFGNCCGFLEIFSFPTTKFKTSVAEPEAEP